MEKYMQQSKEKETLMQHNKKMITYIQDLAKNNECILDNYKAQKEEYQKRFDELMRKLEEEYNYDEEKCNVVAEENARLRAKSEKINNDIQAIDSEYQGNLTSLRAAYEEGNKETENKYNTIKENAQLVDDLRAEIRDLETKKKTKAMSVSMNHKKTTDLEALLKSTFDPLKSYVVDSQKVAGRVKNGTERKEGYLKLKEQINAGTLDIMREVRNRMTAERQFER